MTPQELPLGLPVRFVDGPAVAAAFTLRLRIIAALRAIGRWKHGRVVPPKRQRPPPVEEFEG